MANNYFYRAKKDDGKQYPLNEQIRALEVEVIDENGDRLGVLPTRQAIDLAYERGLDLVAVAPQAVPPVCKILDYGKFQYQQKRVQPKAKTLETKGIRLTFKIGEHDLDIRRQQTEKFLEKGHKVRVELKLRGREKAFREQAKGMVKAFADSLSAGYKTDKGLEVMGGTISILIYKK